MVLSNDKLKKRIETLCLNFSLYIKKFDESNIFTGPSLYFHYKTLDRRNIHKKLEDIFDDLPFFEYLYATLTSWGLHRMGKGKTKLMDFNIFYNSIKQESPSIMELENKALLHISKEDLPKISDNLWAILNSIKVSVSATKLIANSKTLHHILPELMPPVDRRYTLRFFRGSKKINGLDKEIFQEIYPHFYYIGIKNKSEIKSLIGQNFHTSATKVIDNAIVGFVLTEIDKKS